MTSSMEKPDRPVSVFSNRSLDGIYESIRDVYRHNQCPWVIGYSGGKDSTAVLQLVWNALAHLRPEERTKPVYILSSDTLVETPVIVDLIDNALSMIDVAASSQGLPFTTHKVKPRTEDTFWVNMIGKGYPAPNSRFRWCTDREDNRPTPSFWIV